MNPETTDRRDDNEPVSTYQQTQIPHSVQTEDTNVEPTAHPPVATEPATVQPNATSPGIVVLQWLTYAFWGWTILALLFLVGIAATYSLQPNLADTITEQPVAYGIAAVFVLLPISFICDVIYSRREAVHKHGASMVVMVIHAVIFALLGIAALITIAFSLVSLLLGTGDTTGPFVAIIVAVAAALLYVLASLRTVRPFSFRRYRLLFRIIMLVAAFAIATWGVIGPVAQAMRTKDDRIVSSAMQVVYEQISSYAMNENALPVSVQAALDRDGGHTYENNVSRSTIEDLVHRQLITYTRDATPSVKSLKGINELQGLTDDSTKVYYTLCATYKYDHKSSYGSSSIMAGADGYSDYYAPYSNTHAGKNCYKLSTIVSAPAASTQATTLQ